MNTTALRTPEDSDADPEASAPARSASIDKRPCPVCGGPPEFRGIACSPGEVRIVVACSGCGVFQIELAAARLGPFAGDALAAVRAAIGPRRTREPWRAEVLRADRVIQALVGDRPRLALVERDGR